jgi:hypothetical protein
MKQEGEHDGNIERYLKQPYELEHARELWALVGTIYAAIYIAILLRYTSVVPRITRLVVGLSSWRPRVGSFGILVDKVELVQVCLRVLRLSPTNIIPPQVSILTCHLGDK